MIPMNAIYDRLNNVLDEFNSLGVSNQIDFAKLYLYSIITHSTAIEGSTVTETENTLMFDEDIVPAGHSVTEQMMNIDLKRAYDYVNGLIPKKPEITVECLKHLASLVMKNTGSVYNTALGSFDSSKGELRLVNVSAGRGGKSYLSYQKISQRLDDFCKWLNGERKKKYDDVASIYALSFEAHYRLVSIHPWVDGNGRTCRLLMNMIQMENNLLPSILRKENKAKYIDALSASQEQKDSSIFVNFMMDAMANFILQCIADYKNSDEI